jgi:catechol 2,3-dioxygenase
MKLFHNHQAMSISKVYLLIKDLNRSLFFYHQILGLNILSRNDKEVLLGTSRHELIHLTEDVHALPQSITLGLYHFALLLPNRLELARMIYRLKEMKYPVTGASDHGVSEAIYLDDPDGNGIEIYADREESNWPIQNGKMTMFTHALDIKNVLQEITHYHFESIHEDTVMGHLHLHVDSLKTAEFFYVKILGFQEMLLYGGSALFVSDQGYHHHLGLNTWHQGAPLCEKNQVGLKGFVLNIPKLNYLSFIQRLESQHIPILTESNGSYIEDPLKQKIYLNLV